MTLLEANVLFRAKEIGLEVAATGDVVVRFSGEVEGIGTAVVFDGRETNPVGKNGSVLFSD